MSYATFFFSFLVANKIIVSPVAYSDTLEWIDRLLCPHTTVLHPYGHCAQYVL